MQKVEIPLLASEKVLMRMVIEFFFGLNLEKNPPFVLKINVPLLRGTIIGACLDSHISQVLNCLFIAIFPGFVIHIGQGVQVVLAQDQTFLPGFIFL